MAQIGTKLIEKVAKNNLGFGETERFEHKGKKRKMLYIIKVN